MSNRLDEPSEQALQRLGVSTYAIPPRRIILERPALEDIIGVPLGPQPVEVVRPADLVHLTFSFENMEFAAAGNAQTPPLLARRTKNRPAFLIVDFHAQHAIEHALFEVAPGYPVKAPPKPLQLGQGTPAPQDPDEGKPGYDLSTAAGLASLPHPPLWASLAGSTRLAFKVTTETLLYSEEGSHRRDACARSQRRAARGATGAQAPPLQVGRHLRERSDRHHADCSSPRTRLPSAASAPAGGVESPQGATAASAELIALGRMQATARTLESRFGLDSALAAVTSANVGNKLGVAGVIEDIDVFVPFEVLPPLPAEPTETPDEHRAPVAPPDLAQREAARSRTAPPPVEHNGRFELWHTRLGVRALGPDGKRVLDDEGKPTVDEHSPDLRTIRAVWARDFAQLPQFGFSSPPAAFPKADGTQDKPLVRTSLNSRDRMMLVHETSNFHLERTATQGNPQRWTPEAVPTNRLMLTALGGWLDSRVLFETLPDGGLTIEEWKHRAALGRDHEVKVVYAGFLMPFGHRASLVKITERKFAAGPAGPVAYMFQRMFIIVREPVRQVPRGSRRRSST